ncbi:MAG: hypothetical protein IJ866_01925 [Alphaproteobacteria bacterium]|nr:hypothetical protein [Alphaproteobacteria bacterium]
MHVSKYPSTNRQERVWTSPLMVGLVITVVVGLLSAPAVVRSVDQKRGQRAQKRAQLENEPKIAARATIFTDYVFDDVKTYVLRNMPSQQEINSISRYHDVKSGKKSIDWLVQDSTKYANAIVRDAPFVVGNIHCHYSYGNEYIPLYPVQQLDDVDSKTLCATAMNFVNKSEKYLDGTSAFVRGPDAWREIKQENPAYKMKINIKHLKDISKQLAYERALQAQAIKNTKSCGK